MCPPTRPSPPSHRRLFVILRRQRRHSQTSTPQSHAVRTCLGAALVSDSTCANPRYGPVYLNKIDISDGFYRVALAASSAPKLAVILPTCPGEPTLLAIPLSLPMGWIESPLPSAPSQKRLPILRTRGCRVDMPRPIVWNSLPIRRLHGRRCIGKLFQMIGRGISTRQPRVCNIGDRFHDRAEGRGGFDPSHGQRKGYGQ